MACPLCDGTGWKPVEAEGVRRVVRCDCWRESVTDRLLREARIPARYARCTLGSLLLYPNEQFQNAVARAQRFAEAYPVVSKGLVLIGPPGIGKTHIAVAVLKEVIARTGARGLFRDTRELLSDIKSTYDPVTKAAASDVLRPVVEAELLVLDDLGSERPTDWVEETMNLIVNTRYNACRATIFTSNYEDLPEHDDPSTLIARIGFRIHSRLREMCEFLEYHGPDFRDLPVNAGPEDLYALWKQRPRRKLPARASPSARVRAPQGKIDLGWSGGKGGS
jgi:DNA replication protein DnaC